ncbi:hypothetical protein DN752_07490 [Echinicola strongylocentroti]|uniref:Uncharacterized protein n=1 Tax=Echinicola strongylocentroti TaxID=1795355 RepID=A0A2Z4IGX6_9BACT|nr:hypothetical protein DN752_07490 [Echinicola strongylocentroti]
MPNRATDDESGHYPLRSMKILNPFGNIQMDFFLFNPDYALGIVVRAEIARKSVSLEALA